MSNQEQEVLPFFTDTLSSRLSKHNSGWIECTEAKPRTRSILTHTSCTTKTQIMIMLHMCTHTPHTTHTYTCAHTHHTRNTHTAETGAIDWGCHNLVAFGCQSYVVIVDPYNTDFGGGGDDGDDSGSSDTIDFGVSFRGGAGGGKVVRSFSHHNTHVTAVKW